MKTKRLDITCTIALFLVNINLCISQTLTISPNSEANAVCPNVDVTYTITNYNAACHSIAHTNGTLVQDNDDGTLIVNWLDNGLKGSITVTRLATGCSGVAPGLTFDVPIRTLAMATPTITGPSGPAAGFQEVVTYTASLNWPFRGTNDPGPPFPVTNFNWTLPTGWTNNTLPATSATINVTPNIGGGGTVTATGITTCGSGALNSLPAIKTIVRTLSVPCPITPQRLTERCGEPGTNFFVASPQPQGYSTNNPQWSWSLPQDWTFIGTPNSQFINVNTDGQHGGNVTVTFSDWGVSASCSRYIPLIVANPGTIATGPDRLCETETYTLTSLPLAAGASATWQITPSNAPITPLSGNGTQAIITPVEGTANGPGSNATLTFTVSGCGLTNTFEKTFFVGRPNIVDHRIDYVPGASRLVCPGWHTMGATVVGDDTNPSCMTWELVNNVGLPPHTLYQVTCASANIYMNPLNTAPAFVKVTATNECGPYQSFFYLYPYLENCKENYFFSIYPNPASSVLHLEVVFDDGQNEAIPMTINHAQLINMMGTIALDLPNIESTSVELDLSAIPNGLYIARAQVGSEWLTETVQVSKN